MTPRSLFSIFIKLLGIFMLLQSFSVVTNFISSLFYLQFAPFNESLMDFLVPIGVSLLAAYICFLIIYYCIFRTDWVIDKLRLDKNFNEEKLDLNIHRSTVLTIAVIVIGGVVLIDSIPNLCLNSFSLLRQTSMPFSKSPDAGWVIFFGLKSLMGLFLITGCRPVVNFIERQRKKQ